jgi:KDO2-lipid IV(A) lauroyltransferase
MYRHFGTILADFVRIPSITAESLPRYVDWRGGDARVRELLAEGRGVILATGHVGNWEMAGAAFALAGLSEGAVARPLDNPLLDRYVNAVRARSGQRIFAKFGALRSVLGVLRSGRGFGILVDQDAGQRGVFVPFFGQPASTIPTAADVALRTGAPIVVVSLQRAGQPMRFVANVSEPIRADVDADPGSERLRLLAAVNAELESQIRRAPAQWLWLHRRWKTRPRDEAPPGAGSDA